MEVKIKLKNSDSFVLLDKKVYDGLQNDDYVSKMNLLENLRLHSSGCAVFQKTWKDGDGEFKTETVYLHRFIAEKFLGDQYSRENNLVGAKNGNKLDCRLSNLIWRSRSTASRQRKTSSKTGYTGVYKENKKYRAIISINGKAVHLGMYQTPEAAAEAYNRKSKELYGDKAKINNIGSRSTSA
jgi:hypothetical protein